MTEIEANDLMREIRRDGVKLGGRDGSRTYYPITAERMGDDWVLTYDYNREDEGGWVMTYTMYLPFADEARQHLGLNETEA